MRKRGFTQIARRYTQIIFLVSVLWFPRPALLCPCRGGLVTGYSWAAPVGNPAGPVLLEGNYPTKFSLEAETVLDRKLESASSGNPKFKGTFYTGKISFYLGKKLDVYGLVGTYEGKIKDFIDKSYIITTKMDAVLGGGVSYVLYEREFSGGVLRLGADAKYRQFEPEIDSVKQYRETVATTNNVLSFKEWQASLGLAYQYKRFIPYVGLKYSDMDANIEFKQGSTVRSDNTIDSKDIWGLFYGLDILLQDSISFNIEGRNIDEKAVNMGLNARF